MRREACGVRYQIERETGKEEDSGLQRQWRVGRKGGENGSAAGLQGLLAASLVVGRGVRGGQCVLGGQVGGAGGVHGRVDAHVVRPLRGAAEREGARRGGARHVAAAQGAGVAAAGHLGAGGWVGGVYEVRLCRWVGGAGGGVHQRVSGRVVGSSTAPRTLGRRAPPWQGMQFACADSKQSLYVRLAATV